MLPKAEEEDIVTAAWQAGECRWNTKEYAPALANYQKAVAAKNPAAKEEVVLQEQALLRVGQCQGQLNQWPASEATFKKFIAAHPEHDQIRAAQHGLGRALKGQKKYASALAAFEPVLSEAIRDELGVHAQFLVGECYLEQKKFNEAIQGGIRDGPGAGSLGCQGSGQGPVPAADSKIPRHRGGQGGQGQVELAGP